MYSQRGQSHERNGKRSGLKYTRILERILQDCLLDGGEYESYIAGIGRLGQTTDTRH